MDTGTDKQMVNTTETSKESCEEPISEIKARGQGFKGHARGGGMWFGGGVRGGRGAMMKGFGPSTRGRGRGREAMNGCGPIRRGMGRLRPYPDPRGHRGPRGGPLCMGPPPPPPPPMHPRGPLSPLRRHGPPPPPLRGHPGFRWRPPLPPPSPPPPRARGMMLLVPPRPFHHRGPRGYHNGPVSPLLHPPPGRGQRWPAPPGGGRHI